MRNLGKQGTDMRSSLTADAGPLVSGNRFHCTKSFDLDLNNEDIMEQNQRNLIYPETPLKNSEKECQNE